MLTAADREADRPVDDDVVILGGAIGHHLEDAVATDDDCRRLSGGHPVHVGVEHQGRRVEIAVDDAWSPRSRASALSWLIASSLGGTLVRPRGPWLRSESVALAAQRSPVRAGWVHRGGC